MSEFKLQGFVPAIVTPFDARGVIDLAAFGAIAEWLVASGATGICIAGDNGEAWALSPSERGELVRTLRQTLKGRVPLILGVSAATTRQSIQYAEIAAKEGADAILLMPPTYVLKATRTELVQHFHKVGRAVPLPIVVYNSPRRSGISMSVEDLVSVCDAAQVVGLKESTQDLSHLSHVLRRLGDRIAVMTGPAPFILPAAGLGARGFISSGPELLGSTAGRLMALGSGAPNDESRRAHHALVRLYEALMSLGTWPSALKAALHLTGQAAGVPREPIQPLSPGDTAQLAALLRELGIIGP